MKGCVDIWFDGSCESNPGRGCAGAVLVFPDGSRSRIHQRLAHCTVNEAEYTALIIGLQHALELGVKEVTVRGDSKLVVEQAARRWAVKSPRMKPYSVKARLLLRQFKVHAIVWVPRRRNKEADMASRAIGTTPFPRR